jgi:chemosensory pili system protein ChpA (sensor histidine kinase/response regulator)
VERIHPADLFYPDLSQPVSLPPAGAADARRAGLAAFRQRFERALLPYLKSATGDAGALLDAVKLVADAQQDGQARAFWLAMQAFAELVAGGRLLAACM